MRSPLLLIDSCRDPITNVGMIGHAISEDTRLAGVCTPGKKNEICDP